MALDSVLELLKDSRWHDIYELAAILPDCEPPLENILLFYERFSFIHFDTLRTKVMLDPHVRELLLLESLPSP